MAKRQTDKREVDGRSQEDILELVMDSAVEATKQAVADNDRQGLASYGGKNGQLVVREPGASVVSLHKGSLRRP